MKRTLLKLFFIVPVLFVLGVCAYMARNRLLAKPPPEHKLSGPPFLSQTINGLTANFFVTGNALRASGNDLFIEFRETNGTAADVGEVRFELGLNMPGMVMHTISKVLHTGTVGQYRANVVPQMVGTWDAKISYAGPRGNAATNFPMQVK